MLKSVKFTYCYKYLSQKGTFNHDCYKILLLHLT